MDANVKADVVAELRAFLAEMRSAVAAAAPPKLIDASWATPTLDIREDIRRLAESIPANTSFSIPSGVSVEFPAANFFTQMGDQLAHLLYLLELSDEERAFVRDISKDPLDVINLSIFADWLKDQQRPREAESMEALVPEPGSLVVVRHPASIHPANRDKLVAGLSRLFDDLRSMGRECAFLVLPADISVESLSAQTMRQMGWVRAPQPTSEIPESNG